MEDETPRGAEASHPVVQAEALACERAQPTAPLPAARRHRLLSETSRDENCPADPQTQRLKKRILYVTGFYGLLCSIRELIECLIKAGDEKTKTQWGAWGWGRSPELSV